MRKAVIMGVGPERGLGAQPCQRLAADGLAVFVAGRTQAGAAAFAYLHGQKRAARSFEVDVRTSRGRG